jgi:hypothetical protein
VSRKYCQHNSVILLAIPCLELQGLEVEPVWLLCSLQAIQSRDRIQLQYSQSLIEKDQYRKQVRGLEAERDELLTTLTSLEGAKALLEAQLQRTQGGPCLKVSNHCPGGRLGLRVGTWWQAGGGLAGKQDGALGCLSFWGCSWDTMIV